MSTGCCFLFPAVGGRALEALRRDVARMIFGSGEGLCSGSGEICCGAGANGDGGGRLSGRGRRGDGFLAPFLRVRAYSFGVGFDFFWKQRKGFQPLNPMARPRRFSPRRCDLLGRTTSSCSALSSGRSLRCSAWYLSWISSSVARRSSKVFLCLVRLHRAPLVPRLQGTLRSRLSRLPSGNTT